MGGFLFGWDGIYWVYSTAIVIGRYWKFPPDARRGGAADLAVGPACRAGPDPARQAEPTAPGSASQLPIKVDQPRVRNASSARARTALFSRFFEDGRASVRAWVPGY